MEQSVRRYIARILLMHLALIAVVVVVIALAGWSLYITAEHEAEEDGLERLTVPTNQTADALERHFALLVDTLGTAGLPRPASGEAADAPDAAPRGPVRTDRGGADGQGAPPPSYDTVWSQVRTRLSALILVEGPELRVGYLRTNAAPPVEAAAQDREATILNIPPALRSGLRTREDAQVLVDTAADWLAGVARAREQAISGVVLAPAAGLSASGGSAQGASRQEPVLLVAIPLAQGAGGEQAATAPARSGPDDPPATQPSVGPASTLLVGVVPIAYLEETFIVAGNQPERSGLLLFDASGRLIAGGGAGLAGTPVEDLAPQHLPPTLSSFIRGTVSGGSDPRRQFDGQVSLGQINFTSSLVVARSVRATGGLGGAAGPAGVALESDADGDLGAPPPARDRDAEPGKQAPPVLASGKVPPAAQSRMWLFALLNRSAAVAPLEETTRTAVLWAVAMVVAMSAILVSSAVQLIRARNRLERFRTEVIDKELRDARHIQLMWLPDDETRRTPMRMLEIAAENVPASHISGDFYNYFDLPDGRTAVVIGDVTGHGMAAAFLMATTQLLVKTTLLRLGHPGEALREVNNLLCTQAFHGQFVTIQIVVVDARARQLQVVSAGHPPPLSCTSDGRWQTLPIDAQIVLGVLEGADYPALTIPIEGCESLLLYTDGVIEAKNAQEERFSLEQFVARLDERVGANVGSARRLASEAMAILDDWADGAMQDDDLTVLAVNLEPTRRAREHTSNAERAQPLRASAQPGVA